MSESDPSEKCRTFKTRIGKIRINFNPLVTGVSAILIWSFVVWCIVDPERTSGYMSKLKRWISDYFTWFYIGVENIWLVFLVIIYFSKYSNLKLGKDDEKPEFSDASYFTMLFAAGVGIGLFYFGVAEPVYHYQPGNDFGNRFWGRYGVSFYYLTQCVIIIVIWQFPGIPDTPKLKTVYSSSSSSSSNRLLSS